MYPDTFAVVAYHVDDLPWSLPWGDARGEFYNIWGDGIPWFAYDGLFGIRAAMAGAEDVVCLEQNAAACERIRANAERNGVSDKVKIERVNCMQDLRNRAETEERFGVVVLDPPAFARNKKELEGAERGYVELNPPDLIESPGLLIEFHEHLQEIIDERTGNLVVNVGEEWK